MNHEKHSFIHLFIHALIDPYIHENSHTHNSSLLLENSIQSKHQAQIHKFFNPPKLLLHPLVHWCMAFNYSCLGTFLQDGQRRSCGKTTRCCHCLQWNCLDWCSCLPHLILPLIVLTSSNLKSNIETEQRGKDKQC